MASLESPVSLRSSVALDLHGLAAHFYFGLLVTPNGCRAALLRQLGTKWFSEVLEAKAEMACL